MKNASNGIDVRGTAVTEAAKVAAAEIGNMRRDGQKICDVAHITSAMRAATAAPARD